MGYDKAAIDGTWSLWNSGHSGKDLSSIVIQSKFFLDRIMSFLFHPCYAYYSFQAHY
jgi:hypothetical protein